VTPSAFAIESMTRKHGSTFPVSRRDRWARSRLVYADRSACVHPWACLKCFTLLPNRAHRSSEVFAFGFARRAGFVAIHGLCG
jgi:hypothetical protein